MQIYRCLFLKARRVSWFVVGALWFVVCGLWLKKVVSSQWREKRNEVSGVRCQISGVRREKLQTLTPDTSLLTPEIWHLKSKV